VCGSKSKTISAGKATHEGRYSEYCFFTQYIVAVFFALSAESEKRALDISSLKRQGAKSDPTVSKILHCLVPFLSHPSLKGSQSKLTKEKADQHSPTYTLLWEKVPGHLCVAEKAETRRHKSKLRGLPPHHSYPHSPFLHRSYSLFFPLGPPGMMNGDHMDDDMSPSSRSLSRKWSGFGKLSAGGGVCVGCGKGGSLVVDGGCLRRDG